MITASYARSMLVKDTKYIAGHGADEDGYLGFGMVYYALAYALKAKMCVCLGSGDGFVPRMMRQAQRDLNLAHSRTILIDNGSGKWGQTTVHNLDSFFRKQFPDVEVWKMDTSAAVTKLKGVNIDFLHIDADHSRDAVRDDFINYSLFVPPSGVITMHDTATKCGVPSFLRELRANEFQYWDAVNFFEIGAGIAIVRRNPDA